MEHTGENERDKLVAKWQGAGAGFWPLLVPHLREAVHAWSECRNDPVVQAGPKEKNTRAAFSPLLAIFDDIEREQKWRLVPPFTSFFELLTDVLTRVMEEGELRRIFFKRDEEQKINVFSHSVNLIEGLVVLEVIKLREFLGELEKKVGRKARVIFRAKYFLGYSYQEIVDFLEVGTGSVCYQLQ